MSIDFIKHSCRTKIPEQFSSGSVGCDLFSTKNYLLQPSKPTLIESEFHIKTPQGCLGLIIGRFNLALKGIITHVDIHDNDYAGSVCVVLTNVAAYPTYKIDRGDCIAQITLVKCDRMLLNFVKDFESVN